MKQFNDTVEILKKKDFKQLNSFPLASFSFLLDFFPKKSVFFMSQNNLEELSFFLNERTEKDVVFLSSPRSSSVDFCFNFFDSFFRFSSHFLITHFPSVDYFFINEKNRNSFNIKVPQENSSCIVDSSFDYDGLTTRLRDLNYLHSSSLESGSFFCKGGTVGVCPYGSKKQYKVSFLEEVPKIFLLNREGFIKRGVSSFDIFPVQKENSVNLFSLLKKKHVFHYKNKSLCNKDFKRDFSKSFSFQKINFSSFVRNPPSSVKIKEKGGLQEFGLLFCGISFVPHWFVSSQKNTPIISDSFSKNEFVAGSIYVHEDFGLCSFLGLSGEEGFEKALLSFADGRISLDVSLLSKLYFYSQEKEGVSLSFLSKKGVWKNRVLRAKKQAEECVDFLKNTYIKKLSLKKIPSTYHRKDVDSFVSSFSFKDTPDQSSCWKEIVSDMCSPTPMNRLVCGDVGFGKTEIAIRSAYLSVLNGRGVVVLAPTTILTNQLYECFKERLYSFGVVVRALSRLQKNHKKTISSFLNNKTDVLIATHSVLFNLDVLKKCGLFIVDEEHRFGVKQKELICEINPLADYLALSATPIPRSMQFCVSKIRNFSLIKTPPTTRKPIISSVHFFDLEFIYSCIIKEINRGGQVFFVDNSVDKLSSLLTLFSHRFPGVVAKIVHGKLPPKEISSTMDSFVSKKTQVLFSTVIIESGIDIPSANTIIVNNSHLLGLAQLHQLRGRVGRSQIQAFAFFLIPSLSKTTNNGKKRLSSIVKNQRLGSGYSLSLNDLEIRGGGFLFGFKQSGFSSVGFEFYSKVLSSFLGSKEEEGECFVDCFNGFLPFSYIPDSGVRSHYYNSIFSCSSFFDLKKLRQNFLNSFGSLPLPVLNLFYNQALSLFGKRKGLFSLSQSKGFLVFSFSKETIDLHIDSFLVFVNSFFKKRGVEYSFKKRDSFLNLQCNFKDVNYLFIRRFIKRLPL